MKIIINKIPIDNLLLIPKRSAMSNPPSKVLIKFERIKTIPNVNTSSITKSIFDALSITKKNQ